MKWEVVTLHHLAPSKGATVSGPFGSNIGSRFFVSEGIPVIRGNNLKMGGNKFIDEGFVFLTEEKASEFTNCVALTDDIILTAAGSIGQVGIIPEAARYPKYIISNKQIRVRIDRSIANPLFVYYWLSSPEMTQFIVNQNNGGAVPLLNLSIVRKLPVPLPPLPIQNKIASTISRYDDLIENNRRRIELLEQAARLLYKEWFVHFRFPGHEHVKIVDGVPEGWENYVVPDVIEINPKESTQRGNSIKYIPMSSLSETGMTINTEQVEIRESPASVRFRNNDVLLARITPCLENGKTAYVNILDKDEVACGSTEFIIMRGKRVSPYFTYCFARTEELRGHAINSMIGSSGRQRVQVSAFRDYQISIPPRDLLEPFDDTSVALMFP